MAANLEARIWAVMGASGVGKGLWIKQQLGRDRPRRLVVWDFMDEYGDFAQDVSSLPAMHALMLKHRKGPLAVRYVPRGAGAKAIRKEFELICEMVYAWGNCTFVAEELGNVTTASWAPAAWRKMTTSGRHQAVHIIGTSQTPALIDKTFLGNCTLVHVCALREHPHRQCVARAIDVPIERITALQKFQFLERDHNAGTLREAWVKVPGAPSVATPTGSDAAQSRQGKAAKSPMKARAK